MSEKNCTRLEEFRQLQKEIRGSDEYLIVGIDVAKERHNAFFGTATGKTLFRRLVFGNDREGFERLLLQAEAMRVQHGLKKVVFGLEPTANYHKPLGEYLITGGHRVVLVSAKSVKRNRELLDGRWDKHDTKDSANVADLISQGKCQYYDYPGLRLRELRSLLSLRRRLKRQEHGLRVRIRNNLLAQYFPEFDGYFGRSESEGLAIVRWCLAPSVIASLEYDQFARWVAPGNRGIRQQARLRAIWQKASVSIGCEVGEAVRFEAKLMVEGLKQIREALGETDEKITDLCVQFPEYECLLSIPGYGPDVSSKVLGAIGNPFRFTRGSQVLKMAGLDLVADRSGKRSDGVVPVISKNGKADLRYALYQAAMIASSRNREFIMWFTNRLRGRQREKGIKTRMRVKLSAKLLIIAWTLMKKKEPFNPDYLRIE
ncbi:MAG: IS110 family transposase [Gammaproteobacteria bacterium]|nr:IS110 family transposase [Gammaproteobacteria bacterium]